MGFITANIEYTNSLDKYKEKGVFRILDEITACIKSIRKELESQNFDGAKLELALYGISAGGQLILLYTFSDKNDKNNTIPIKFIMNSVGICNMDPKYWYKPAKKNITLDNIELAEEIEKEKKWIDEKFILHVTNLMSGKKLAQQELDVLIINNKINTDDPKYQEMYKYAKYGYPLYVIGKCIIPMLCLYGGNDDLVGVVHYSYLREAYINNGAGDKIELVYMKYAGHERFHHNTGHDIIAMKEIHIKMIEYAKKYFTQD